MSEVVIPLGNGAATLSAYGIASTDVVRTFELECRLRAPFDAGELGGVIAAIESRAATEMRDSGFEPSALVFERFAVMRYAEQLLHDLPIAVASGVIDQPACAQLAARFDAEYVRLYGEGARSIFQAVEVIGIRVRARVPLGFVPTARAHAASNGGSRTITGACVRQVYWPEERGWVPTAVHDGRDLRPGDRINGPAVVELPYTTIAVGASHRLTLDATGNYVMSIG